MSSFSRVRPPSPLWQGSVLFCYAWAVLLSPHKIGSRRCCCCCRPIRALKRVHPPNNNTKATAATTASTRPLPERVDHSRLERQPTNNSVFFPLFKEDPHQTGTGSLTSPTRFLTLGRLIVLPVHPLSLSRFFPAKAPPTQPSPVGQRTASSRVASGCVFGWLLSSLARHW